MLVGGRNFGYICVTREATCFVLDLREKAIKMPDCHFQSSLYFEEREVREYWNSWKWLQKDWYSLFKNELWVLKCFMVVIHHWERETPFIYSQGSLTAGIPFLNKFTRGLPLPTNHKAPWA